MKRLKSIFLVLVIMLLSLELASNTYARERAGENDREHSSHRSRGGRDNSGGRLDGRTSGLGRELGGIVGGAAGGAIGGKYGGKTGRNIGAAAGREIGKRTGDAWERRANRGAHDKWNSKSRNDRGYGGGWRFSDEID